MRSETRTRLENIEVILNDRSERIATLEKGLLDTLGTINRFVDAVTARFDKDDKTFSLLIQAQRAANQAVDRILEEIDTLDAHKTQEIKDLRAKLEDTDLIARMAASVLSSERTRKAREAQAKGKFGPTGCDNPDCECRTPKAPLVEDWEGGPSQ